MKKLILLSTLFCLAAALAFGQSPVIISQPYKFQKWVNVKDSLTSDGTLLDADSTHKVATTAFLKKYFNAHLPATLTFNGGLTRNINNVSIGGDLIQTSTISSGDLYALGFSFGNYNNTVGDPITFAGGIFDPYGRVSLNTSTNSGVDVADFQLKPDDIYLTYRTVGNVVSGLFMNPHEIRFLDQQNNMGIIYDGDYSANGRLNPRHLPDIAEVRSVIDSAITGGIPPGGFALKDSTDQVNDNLYKIVNKATARTNLQLGTSNNVTFNSISASGTSGSGYVDLLSQSVSPASTSGHLKLYSDSLNRLSWKNSSYRRTIRVGRASDQTISMPYRFNPTVADSTDIRTYTDSAYSKSKRRLGVIYNVTPSTSNSASYSTVGSTTTWTYASDGLTAAGGDGTVNNSVRYNKYWTNATYNERPTTFVVLATGAGLGTGFWSLSAGATVSYHLNTSTGTLTLEVYRAGTTTIKATSASNLTISTGDTIIVKGTRSMANFFVTATDKATGAIVFVNYTDPYTSGTVQTSWSAAHPTIVNYGGTNKIVKDSYCVNNIVGNDIVLYGNSIAQGLSSGSSNNAYGNILGANMNDNVNLIAGGSNKTSDFLLLEQEIKLLKPRILIYADGINDVVNSVSQDSTNAHLTAANKFCRDNGIQMVFNTVLPVSSGYGGASNATYQAAIITTNTFEATLPDAIIANTYSAVLNSVSLALDPLFDSGDGLHENKYGHEALAVFCSALFKNLTNIGGFSHADANGWKTLAFVGARGGITVQNTSQAVGASSMFTALSNDNVHMMTMGLSSATSGSNGNDAAGPLNGQLVTTTGKLIMSSQNRVILNVGATAVASGNKFILTPTGIKIKDNLWIGDTTGTASALLELKAGTTALAPFGYNSGPLLTTPSIGKKEFLTDKEYLTITTGAARKEIALFDLAGTSGRVPYETTNGRLTDASGLTFDGTNLTAALSTTSTAVTQAAGTNNTSIATSAALFAERTNTVTLLNKTFGDKLRVSTAANAGAGTASLVAGTVTVSNTSITASSIIIPSRQAPGGTVGTLSYTVSAGVGFTITSSSGSDTSTLSYVIIN